MKIFDTYNKKTFFLSIYYIVFIFLVLYIKGTDYWMDEMFTYHWISDLSFVDLYKAIKSDVHPPLYFFLIKIFTSIFGSNFLLLRFFSTLPLILLFFTGLYPVKRLFGEKTTLVFLILLIAFPTAQYLITEVRMYSWTTLLFTLFGIYLYDYYINNTKKSFLLTLIFSLGCCYIHNYALVGIFVAYALLYVYLMISKKWEVLIKITLLSILTLGGYLPWFIDFISQVKQVTSNYWIPDISFSKLLQIGFFVFIFFIFFIFYPLIAEKRTTDRVTYAVFLFFIPFVVFILVYIFSISFHSIFLGRYFTAFFGIYALSIAISYSEISNQKTKNIFRYSVIILLFISYNQLYSDNKKYNKNEIVRKSLDSFLSKYNIDAVFVYNFNSLDRYLFYGKYLDLKYGKSLKSYYFSDTGISDKNFNFLSLEDIRSLPRTNNIIYLNAENANRSIFLNNKKYLNTQKYYINDSLTVNDKKNIVNIYYFKKKN